MSNNNDLLDLTIERNNLTNDAALSRLLGVAPPVISKVRHDRLDIGPSLILSLIERANMPLDTIRKYVPRKDSDHVSAQ